MIQKGKTAPVRPMHSIRKMKNVKSKRPGRAEKARPKGVKQKPRSITATAWRYLDLALRLRLADLDSKRFEDFFLRFLNSGVHLTVERNGKAVKRRVIRAETDRK